ncbi:MAG: penicillin-binding protein 2 [Candidatus Liptonbacteria bacterium]|nr:penicillin-binding protein 2 [Candidatus Liptonbacteria bacterium]
MGVRFSILTGFFAIAYAYLLFHLYDVQLASGEYYFAQAESRYFAPELLEATRGVISFIDRDGRELPVAINKDFPLIYAVPKAIEDPEEAAHALADAAGIPTDELVKKFSKRESQYESLVNKADTAVANAVDRLKIKGIYVVEKPKRFYPFGPLASHVLGYVGPKPEGIGARGFYGIEKYYEGRLAGTAGEIDGTKLKPPLPGEDIALTIDPNIQTEAERVLRRLVQKYSAGGGGVIVEEPRSGKILAMAALQNFDPNEYSRADIKNFLNPMVQAIYEPGSIFKVITMAAGIDSGKITPDTTYTDRGTLTLNGRTIRNYDLDSHGPYGKVTMHEVIEHSINTGAVFAQQATGRDVFTEYVKNFGFGEKTGIGLPGEVEGDLKRLNPKERDISFATASYGQGVAVTPIALVNAISAIANDGVRMRPYVNAELSSEIVQRVVSQRTAAQVTQMMLSAVDKAGVAKVSGYSLAGKTGTAFIPDFAKGGYTDRVINTYVGFGPTADPRFTILVRLDDPEGAPVAALTVVPAFRELSEFMLNYFDIPPDRITAQ